ncbi:hypothetical protein BGX20_000825 [Mortierella sp. AD010]|nr:hypothetical protein BGX20_000825 [Mortierella sp. AD010]
MTDFELNGGSLSKLKHRAFLPLSFDDPEFPRTPPKNDFMTPIGAGVPWSSIVNANAEDEDVFGLEIEEDWLGLDTLGDGDDDDGDPLELFELLELNADRNLDPILPVVAPR